LLFTPMRAICSAHLTRYQILSDIDNII
jgi:hypothetical protein